MKTKERKILTLKGFCSSHLHNHTLMPQAACESKKKGGGAERQSET